MYACVHISPSDKLLLRKAAIVDHIEDILPVFVQYLVKFMDPFDQVIYHFDALEDETLLQEFVVAHQLLDHSQQSHRKQSFHFQAIVLLHFLLFGWGILAFLREFLNKYNR